MTTNRDSYRTEKQMSYDEQCKELAEHFLSDEPGATPEDAHDLAQTIQDAVEGWFTLREAPPSKMLGFAAAVRTYGDNWVQNGFAWTGESYRGLSPATIIAMQDSRGPDDRDMHRMRCCERWGRDYQR
jgi:hypothetical protein